MPTGVYERRSKQEIALQGLKKDKPTTSQRTRELTSELDRLVGEVGEERKIYASETDRYRRIGLSIEITNKERMIAKIKSDLHFLLTGEHKSFR